MARRQLLTDEQWARLLAPPNDEREIVRHYTLSRDDLDLIAGKRSGHSRLGFAVLLYMRHPGRVLDANEIPPPELLAFIADRLDIDLSAFAEYRRSCEPTTTAKETAAICPLPRASNFPVGLKSCGAAAVGASRPLPRVLAKVP